MWDLETSPHATYTWGLFQQNVGLNQIEKPGEVICFAAQWADSKKVEFHSVHHDGKEAMLQAAWDLINEADALVSWNGKAFDSKTMNKEFLLAGMSPPAPIKEIDLMLAARKQFRLASNKLEFVSRALGLPGKVQHEGFQLWLDCMAGDEKAWARMKRYCIQDVKLLKPIYEKLLPWLPAHPNVNLYDGTEGCPKCGSDHVQKRGLKATNVSLFQQYQCQECKSWFQGGKRIAGVELRSA
ncbi:hypothetical protein C1I92_13180 [Jiangella anatolica]|uniref:YprB ribonuclease H-like domain-containing protein n=2 Tax=Jiangella anatolica TaxID=2670374 RepID=A0A2W2BRZ5_9ACTN|nr:hypothetical protein C1I92_13180 [Jiangella anatolica]